ncbi:MULTISPECIES: SDR family oxidoreductase [Marinobacter]|uniref:Peroxisomal trans-2-enoyl-CoA reductase n=1 Tax=Marinobacter xiaoshiensis TaxID=3073652 RepID=A0ABU2HE11_9GAMM|nr:MULTISPECIES: SDR family oxidoreductase [unclassified Marinobacter]MBK1873495.1 SDR family oxidoreductase [Marinobacter sp. 1-3A]MBK1885285.1 SDR family oxidoreductase [Marinobacter sp. DY40_1A1]MDS1309306.1 SDR family oxidoreductase [Marinobacter sp. F60267]
MSYQSVFRPDLFKGQTFIVTGGGSGIGRCTAHELASLGAKVALVGRKVEKVEAVKAEILEDGGIASAHVCDIREEESVKATVKAIIEEHGGLNGVVNNAGGQFPSPLAGINQKGWETVVRTNLTGGFLMAREAYTQALSKTGGSIVNIVADMWGGMPGMGHSGAARAGMVNFTQTAAVEWGTSGVRVNAVAPGWIASSGMDNYPEHMKQWIRSLGDNVPIKRMGTESEISAAICFLLSPGASFISGDCLRIDGAASQGSRIWPLPKAKNNEPFNGFHRAVTPKVLSED